MPAGGGGIRTGGQRNHEEIQGAAGRPDSENPRVTSVDVQAQLARIVSSQLFTGSRRLCRFLRFIIERTLAGDEDSVKEFTVALEVFDRGHDYDPNIDSIVRVEARRLRKKLEAYHAGPGADDPLRIALRPGRYVPVLESTARGRETQPSPPSSDARYTTIAVLPLVNMSPEPDQDYFCDGITEEIINALASLKQVAVVSRTSSFQFKGWRADVHEVGARLGAQLIVEGSVRKSGSQLRITAQAIDAASGYHIWSETFRRQLHDIFAIQEEISLAIARTVHARLPTRPFRAATAFEVPWEAYTSYCKARHLLHQQTPGDLQAAMAEFRALIERYPRYVDPFAGLAMVHAVLALFGAVSGKQIYPELRRHAEEAVRLNPESSDGWTIMGGVSAHWEFDWPEAERRFRRAIALQPSNDSARSWFGMVLTMLGRFEEAELEVAASTRLNPLFPAGFARQGFLSYLRGDLPRATSQLQQALQLAPLFPDTCFVLGMVYLRQGDTSAAIEILSRSIERAPLPLHMGMLAAAHQRHGNLAESRTLIARFESMSATQCVTPMARVAASVGIGDLDSAMQALTDSIEDRAVFANLLNVDPFLDPLRQDPRFNRLIASMNLSPRPASR